MLSNFPSSILQTVLCVICSYGVYFLYGQLTVGASRARISAQHDCRPPKKWPTKDPIFGIDFLYTAYKGFKKKEMLEIMPACYATVGSTTCEFHLLRQKYISTIEPENLKSILSLDFKSWGLGYHRKKALTPFLGEGIFSTDGAAWQHSRDMLRPNFVRSQYGDIQMFERHVQNLIQAVPRDRSTVDLQDIFFRMTLDIATEFLFGHSTDCLAPGFSDARTAEFVKAFTYCEIALFGGESKWGFLGLFLPDPRLRREYKTVHRFVDEVVQKALANQEHSKTENQHNETDHKFQKSEQTSTRYLFLHELISQTPDKVKIRSELLNILLAGRDTTASLLSNIWFELSKRPTVWAQLKHEVDSLDGRLPTFERLKDMKYLRALLNESLRLYPVVPENDRQAKNDIVLPVGGGADGKSPVFVAKGQMAHWSVYAMHRRKDLFGEDADEFKPERWLDRSEQKGLRVGWEYLPFNGGPRICIGQQFALTETGYITVRLMQQFVGVESRDPEPWREKLTLTCTGAGGCKLGLIPRT